MPPASKLGDMVLTRSIYPQV